MSRHVEDVVHELAIARQRQGISGRLLARRLNLSEMTVYGWENGRHQPDLTTLRRWALELGYRLTLTPIEKP